MTISRGRRAEDAPHRSDADWPAGHLDARTCPPGALGRLIQHPDPRRRHLGLVLLAERVASVRAAGQRERAELAALLPPFVVEPPEAALVQAGLYAHLGPYLGSRPWPSWRTAGLPVPVQIAWVRAELLADPMALGHEAPGELLYQAVRQAHVTSAHRPERLVAELAGSGDQVLRAEALRLARQGLHAALLAPARVRELVVGLLDAGGADPAGTEVVAAALRELAEPWAAVEPLPRARLAAFLATGPGTTAPEVAGAALEAAARHGHRDLVRGVAGDRDQRPVLRRRALELLGDLAERGDIRELTVLAAQDPLLLGDAVVTCLRGLHRRGHFPADQDVPAIVGLALANHAIEPREVATILFTCRQAMFRTLVDAAVGDPSWPRRLALLVALAGQGVRELPIGEEITRLLPSAADPGPFLAAIRELRHTEAEDAVIALLPTTPAAALDALEAIGGHRTVRALRDGLGLPGREGTTEGDTADGATVREGAGVIAPYLRAVRGRALELLWHLTGEPDDRRGLLVRLDPTDLPPRIASDLGGPDEHELALLSSHLDPDQPLAALCRLATHGGAATLPVITDLLLRVVSDLAASWEPGGAGERPDGEAPDAEPTVPGEAENALLALGARLYERGRIRPTCLLEAADAHEAGKGLVATLALDLLDRPGLSGGEQMILVELLSRNSGPHTRARVHHLLRHRDRHVRKHVIALLARDATGEDARALSATLIALTTAQDIQTVRQALLALGHARAHWAGAAIAACLGHQNMNIKKTAARALARAGAPSVVPALLTHLGRHDNAGLRAGLVEALRAILGDAYATTVLAAAERDEDSRSRALLLEGLDRVLTIPTLLALADQASPAAPALLALVACGRVRPASGTWDDLAPALAGHGIAAPTARTRHDEADSAVTSLLSSGWHPSVALRLAECSEPPHADRLRGLRPMLADWLRLAESASSAARDAVLRITLRLCPAPWTDGELTAFARSTGALLDTLARTPAADRHDLIAVLEAVAPRLRPVQALTVADTVRALPPGPASTRSTLTLLRRCGAVLVRADLDRELTAARLRADPGQAETAVLREAFDAETLPAGAWQTALAAAARTPAAVEEFRRHGENPPSSRAQLSALIATYGSAAPEVRAILLDWMTSLQPLDAPRWTISESTAPPEGAPDPARAPRTVRIDDLDQPRSAALRGRLLAMLDSPAPDRRNAAARALASWPEPEVRLLVLRAALRGRTTVPLSTDLARTMTTLDAAELLTDGIPPENVIGVASRLAPPDLEPLLPLLLQWWEHGPPALHAAAAGQLRKVPADALARHLGDRLDAGAWGFADLLAGRTLLRTPALTRMCHRLRAEGHGDLADRILLTDGPLRGPDAAGRDAAVLASLRDRPPLAASHRPARQELLDLARTGAPEQIQRALTRLAEEHHGPDPDPAMRELIDELLHHAKPKVRLHAHRVSRAVLDRRSHLRHTAVLLHDPQPDVIRMAIRILCRAAWEPAIPALVGLLGHAQPAVRRSAAEGLVRLGTAAIPELRRAADRARPDRRSRYSDVLRRITAAGTGERPRGDPAGRRTGAAP